MTSDGRALQPQTGKNVGETSTTSLMSASTAAGSVSGSGGMGKKIVSSASISSMESAPTVSPNSTSPSSPSPSSVSDYGIERKEPDLGQLENRLKTHKFRFVRDFSAEYKGGDDVFPNEDGHISTTKRVYFAKHKESAKTVVVKMRHKERSFKDANESRDWIETMKLFYMLTAPNAQPKKILKGEVAADSSMGGNYTHNDIRYMNTSHIAKVLDIVEDEKYYYCVMEFVRGRDLFEYFVTSKPHEQGNAVDFAASMAREIFISLDRMHSMGLIHRDIKLENIVFDEEKKKQESGKELGVVPKIIDFDTCEMYHSGYKTVYVLGTDQYIAPESYAGFASPQADLWAVGVILYVFLTGTFPFAAKLFDDEAGENYVGHIRMDQIRRRLRVAKIDWSHKVWQKEPKAKDLVRRCLVTDARRRITVPLALTHPFIKR